MMNVEHHFPFQKKFNRLVIGFTTLLSVIFIASLMLGIIPIGLDELFHYFSSSDTSIHFTISLRFQREIIALCCGGMLALGSAIIQGLTRNPMVAPDLTGMTSVGCLFVVVCEMIWIKSPVLNLFLGVAGAFLGFLLCFSLTSRIRNRLTVILTGISISFTANAIMQLFILHAKEDIANYLHFITGSLYAVNGISVWIVFVITLMIVPLVFMLGRRFSVVSLDDQTCYSLGVPLQKYWITYFFLASLLVGTSIIGVGHLGFLGIISPNMARMLIGNRPQYIFPLSFLIGGFTYLLADTIGRCIISPAEIPAGIITNMMSAPVFLYILFRYYRGQHEWN